MTLCTSFSNWSLVITVSQAPVLDEAAGAGLWAAVPAGRLAGGLLQIPLIVMTGAVSATLEALSGSAGGVAGLSGNCGLGGVDD